MTALTQEEQLFLELVNRARLDPQAEVIRQGLTSIDQFTQPGVTPSTPMSLDPKQPLAGSNILTGVAERHAAFVFDVATRPGSAGIPTNPHDGAGDGSVQDRIKNAGYNQNFVDFHWYRWENFAVRQDSNPIQTDAQKQAAIETMHHGLFFDQPHANDPVNSLAGHRLAMLDPLMKEMGAGMTIGVYQGFNTAMAFQNFGDTGTNAFITGAVYTDKDGDNFYDLGESVANVTVTVKDTAGNVVGSDKTGSGGGYSVSEGGNTHTVTFTGGSAGSVSAIVQDTNLNAKVDLVNGNRIESNVSTTLGAGAKDLRLIGMDNVNGTGNGDANTITGNKGANILDGMGGNDSIDGGAGDDTVILHGNKADYQVTVLSTTSARLTDSHGETDTIFNIEHVHFNDQTIDFSALKTTVPTPPPAVAGSVSIDDVEVFEGASGQTFANFTVTRAGGTAAFDVKFATADGSATVADGDYAQKSDTLHFAAGVNKQTITIAVNGDSKVEGNETFSVNLSGPTNGATITDGQGIGTIKNDDATPTPTPTNHAPVVTTSNVKVAAHMSVAASSLFKATDADGNGTIKQYAFWDAGSGGGHFTFNGVTQGAGKWIVVNASDLAKVKYVGGPAVGSEKLYVTASDGSAWASNVSLTAVTGAHSPEDFNGDNASDILWQRSNGSVAMWQMNGNKIVSNKSVGSVSKAWHVEGTDDFGGDGKADVLFRNDSGKVALWQMDGNKIVSNQTVGTAAKSWHISAVDDFGGDGKADVLFTNDAGKVAMWQMNGKTITSNTTVGTLGTNWHVEGSGDFNGDGKADLLVESKGGSVAIWTMNGNKVASTKTVGKVSTDWHFAGAGDFNGDGKDDILWHNDNGKVAMWQMNGTTISSNKTVGTANKTWDVADVGDYNHDGHADVLWQKSNGSVAMWEMDGNHIEHNVGVGAASTDWLII